MDTLVPKENSKDLHPADPMADERAEGQASAETSGSGGRTKAEKTHPDGEAATGAAEAAVEAQRGGDNRARTYGLGYAHGTPLSALH